MEWNYGLYEGRTAAQIRNECPGWDIFTNGCPGGETLSEVAARADEIIARLKKIETGYVLLFSHAHFLRILTVRWLLLEPTAARLFMLAPTSLSILGCHHNIDEPVINLWNEIDYLSN